jgi:hypothetical protein
MSGDLCNNGIPNVNNGSTFYLLQLYCVKEYIFQSCLCKPLREAWNATRLLSGSLNIVGLFLRGLLNVLRGLRSCLLSVLCGLFSLSLDIFRDALDVLLY